MKTPHSEYRKALDLNHFIKHSTVDPLTGCWNWNRGIMTDGYAQIAINRKPMHASRAVWIVLHGPIKKGLYVCHRCDNPKCVNPDHLWLGTPTQNTQDKIKKGRANSPNGGKHWNAKLTEQQVAAIRSDSRSCKILSAEYGVSFSHICSIKRRDTWKM